MVMQDSSPFRWLEERGPACALIAVIDDATSRLGARLVEHDTTEENLRTFGGWLRRYGRDKGPRHQDVRSSGSCSDEKTRDVIGRDRPECTKSAPNSVGQLW
jgi:hypothetical protein